MYRYSARSHPFSQHLLPSTTITLFLLLSSSIIHHLSLLLSLSFSFFRTWTYLCVYLHMHLRTLRRQVNAYYMHAHTWEIKRERERERENLGTAEATNESISSGERGGWYILFFWLFDFLTNSLYTARAKAKLEGEGWKRGGGWLSRALWGKSINVQ